MDPSISSCFGATPPPEAPVSKASSRPRAWPTQPGSWGANPDVRPEFRQPVASAHVGCHSLRLRLIPSRRLVAGSAPMQLRFHWLPPKRSTFISFIAICPERCQSLCARPRHSTIGLQDRTRKGFWLRPKVIQSKRKRVTQIASETGYVDCQSL